MEYRMAALALSRPRGQAVGIWLLVVALLIALMVTVGGLTRLTGSGLSITEWKPVTGVIPPLSDSAWHDEFAKYQRIPQFVHENPNMNVAGFKAIYWWEWSHRLLGRLLGVAFLLPFLYFAATGAIPGAGFLRMIGLFALGGLQGFVGWWMVESGLETRVSVSQYRLAIHLGVALILFGAIIWTGLDYWRASRPRQRAHNVTLGKWALGFVALVYLQMLLGALVAGLHAGLIYNTWPSMDGRAFPEHPFFHQPWWVNFGESPGLAQFDHRIGAYIVAFSALALWMASRRANIARMSATAVIAVTGFQIVLGILTLLNQAPVVLAALHQVTAAALLASAIWHAHALLPSATPREKPWPTRVVASAAFLIGALYGGYQAASHNPDWSNIHVQIGVFGEAFGMGIIFSIIAWGACYLRNRDFKRPRPAPVPDPR
jgi:cytochrome c oxidase assembly protein subunit 15